MSNIATQIGQRLRAIRKAAGYHSAKSFAKQHKFPESTYSQHETGKRSINAETLLEYSRLIGFNPGWLLTGTGIPFLSNDIQDSHYQQLEEELRKLNVGTNDFHVLPLINNGLSIVDTDTLSQVLTEILIALEKQAFKVNPELLIDFCINVYNSVISSGVNTQEQKKSIISISVSSLIEGSKLKTKTAEKN